MICHEGRMFSRPLLGSLILCSVLSLACDDDGDSECAPLRAACDISSAQCQSAVFRATACERGQSDAKLPKVRVITRDDLRDELESEVGGYKSTPQEIAWERANQLLGFLPTGQSSDQASVELLVEGIAAYYSSRTKSITVIEDSAEDKDSGSFTLSHEFVHALQDQREGFSKLDQRYVDSSDAMLALDALTEGEATLLSNYVMLRADGEMRPEYLDFSGYFRRMLSAFLDDIAESPSPLLAALQTLSYPVGGAGLAEIVAEQGLAGVRKLYSAPWTTLSSWIDKPAQPESTSCPLLEGPDGHEVVVLDRLGAAGLLALDVVGGLGTDLFLREPERWRGDLITVYATAENSPESVAVRYQVQLASTAAAEELFEVLQALESEQFKVLQSAREVQIFAADSAETLANWDVAGCDAQALVAKARGDLKIPSGLAERLGIVH